MPVSKQNVEKPLNKKSKVNSGTSNDMQLFIEVVSYGFELNNNSQGSLSLGIALVSF